MNNVSLKAFSATIFALFTVSLSATTARGGPLEYSYVDLEYGMDSTIQIEGGDYDADDNYLLSGSYEPIPHLFLWGSWEDAGYDLSNYDDLRLSSLSIGIGYETLVQQGDCPLSLYGKLGYEYLHTELDTPLDYSNSGKNGGSLGFGLRKQLFDDVELFAELYERSYGSRFFRRKGTLDGLFFNLGLLVSFTEEFAIKVSYRTGEYDYKNLPGLEDSTEVEVDRDQFLIGARYSF